MKIEFRRNGYVSERASKISVVIPTYNRKELLERSVQSCLKQAWTNLEIIIVDDGSTDGTDFMVSENIQGNWQGIVRYHRQKNAGASSARNTGLEMATGEYVQFLDSDDFLLYGKFARQVDLLENGVGQYDGCFSYGLVGESINESENCRQIGVKCNSSIEYVETLCSRIVHCIQTASPLWRRSFLMSHPRWGEEISLGDDWEYHLRLASLANGFQFVEAPLFFLEEHSGDRLSDFSHGTERIASAILAEKSVVSHLESVKLWNKRVSDGMLKRARTLYFIALALEDDNAIDALELHVRSLVRLNSEGIKWTLLIAWRRLFGGSMILNLFRALRTLSNRVIRVPWN